MPVRKDEIPAVYKILREYLSAKQTDEVVTKLLALGSANESFNETLRRIKKEITRESAQPDNS